MHVDDCASLQAALSFIFAAYLFIKFKIRLENPALENGNVHAIDIYINTHHAMPCHANGVQLYMSS